MQPDLSLLNLLILFGAVQGLIFGSILLFNKNHPGARFLSIFMLALSYNGFETFNWSSGLSDYHYWFDIFPFITIFLLGPCIYLYIKTLLCPEQHQGGKHVLKHFALPAFQLLFRFSLLVFHLLWINGIIGTTVTPAALDHLYVMVSEPLSVAVFIAYVVASIRLFRRVRSIGNTSKITGHKKSVYQWVTALLVCITILAIAWPATIIAPLFFDIPDSAHYYPIEIGLVFFIYWIAFTGFYRTKTIYATAASSSSALSVSQVSELLDRLKQAMEQDKLYRDPALNLNKVAAVTGISPKTISSVLNQNAGQSFNEFVNGYRIAEVQSRLLLPESKHLTISGIALDCGFNSQATFQRAFRSATGVSPREYVAGNLEKSGKA